MEPEIIPGENCSITDFVGISEVIQYTSFVLTVLTCVMGLVGNATVIGVSGFIMKKHKCKIWFLNLAAADFAFSLSLPLQAVAMWTAYWPFGSTLCKLYNYLSMCNLYASIFTIVALNIDRVLSIAKPLWHLKFFSQRICLWTCYRILFLSDEHVYDNKTECRMISVEQWNRKLQTVAEEPNINTEEMTQWGNSTTEGLRILYSISISIAKPMGWCQSDLADVVYLVECTLIPCLVIGYIIPLGVIVFSNITIALQGRRSQAMKSPRLYKVVIAIILFFFLTWTPLVICEMILLIALRRLDTALVYKIYAMMPILYSIANMNCCLNPIIYVLAGSKVRGALTHFLSSTRATFSMSSYSSKTQGK
ncbi:hypothetical protein GDO86_013835 [Hymenochirus boettgeri]|uniref:G-protein coupled receptors family 1 profile domain-containing protein n=1 Tax=Hymenochirus boettgeri TaxID=247094 RepID=A0A8T2JRL9_9PIPI|nr:hypothetical protein GDO86_013835 [Hymenochirus boettgeri]